MSHGRDGTHVPSGCREKSGTRTLSTSDRFAQANRSGIPTNLASLRLQAVGDTAPCAVYPAHHAGAVAADARFSGTHCRIYLRAQPVSLLTEFPRRSCGGTAGQRSTSQSRCRGLRIVAPQRFGESAVPISGPGEQRFTSDPGRRFGDRSGGGMDRRTNLLRHHGVCSIQLLQPLDRRHRRAPTLRRGPS